MPAKSIKVKKAKAKERFKCEVVASAPTLLELIKILEEKGLQGTGTVVIEYISAKPRDMLLG